MQEIKKSRIVIASVLKPVDDTRMFEKIGATLSEVYDVHIIGYPSARQPDYTNNNIHLYPLKRFSRLSIGRLFAPLSILMLIRKLRPQVVIICTHELLTIGVLAKALTGCKLIYDIQENYAINVRYGNTVAPFIKRAMAFYIRCKEHLFSRWVQFFFLAERSYALELRFIGKRYAILENKLTNEPARRLQRPTEGVVQLLFSGTLAETTGVFEAITLAEKLHEKDPRIKLTIAGYSSQESVRNRIRAGTENRPFIQLIGIDSLVPHRNILDLMMQADFGIISYPDNPSTRSAVPTKLFEYLGHQLPILLSCNEGWEEICKPYPAAIAFNPVQLNADLMLHEMRTVEFYQRLPTDVFWSSEKPKLIDAVHKVQEV